MGVFSATVMFSKQVHYLLLEESKEHLLECTVYNVSNKKVRLSSRSEPYGFEIVRWLFFAQGAVFEGSPRWKGVAVPTISTRLRYFLLFTRIHYLGDANFIHVLFTVNFAKIRTKTLLLGIPLK